MALDSKLNDVFSYKMLLDAGVPFYTSGIRENGIMFFIYL